ncbi:MAG: ABC transporter ATP-binding protein [Burkholderiales bacterium]|nr:ABC transporter ATP-binding protein [Burkholderiales bacterium]
MDRYVEAERATIAYPRKGRVVEAVRDVSLSVANREFVALVGPSGCGKTTLLHAIGGLVPIQSGQIRCAGRPVTGPGPERVMVFQEFSLLRWRDVRRNVEFALECNRVPAAQRKPIVDRLLKQVGLANHADAYPDQLSGGMKQRVAIARALAYDAEVLLMDEPFGALDAQTRLVMQALLLEIWEGSRKTVVFVTHDIDEAIYLADRILIMSTGPGTVKAEYPVKAPRPRPADFVISEQFLDLKRRIYGAIRAEDFRKPPQAGQAPVSV